MIIPKINNFQKWWMNNPIIGNKKNNTIAHIQTLFNAMFSPLFRTPFLIKDILFYNIL